MRLIKKLVHGIHWRVTKVERRLYRWFLYHHYLPVLYKRESKKPIEEKAVFLEIRHAELSDNFLPIYQELQKGGKLKLVCCFIGEGRLPRREQWKNNGRFIKEMATAKYVFLNDSSRQVSCVPLRQETKVVQLWHACGAFKKFGYSTTEKIFGGSKDELEKYPYHKNFSYVTVSSPEVIWAYAQAFHMEDQKDHIVATGISRTDLFFDEEKKKEAYDKVHREVPITNGKKIILYAPTFRGRVAHAASPDEMDLWKMKKALGDQYVMLMKHHPFVKERPVILKEVQDFAMDVTDRLTIEELLMVSDICISDYSSLIFEYSLFERPMIFYAYDQADYDDWRGFYYDYHEMTPGPVVTTDDEIIDYITNVEDQFDRQQVADFRYKFMRSCDGHATERILELLKL